MSKFQVDKVMREAILDPKVASAFKADTGILVELHGSLNIAEANNAGLRIGQGRQRYERRQAGHDDYEHDFGTRRSGHGNPLERL